MQQVAERRVQRARRSVVTPYPRAWYVEDDEPAPQSRTHELKEARLPGHHPPRLAVEVVSRSRPHQDDVTSPKRHELLGTEEL